MMTETFSEDPVNIDGYYGYCAPATRAQRRGRPSGGVQVCVKPHLQPNLVTTGDNYIVVETTSATLICGYFNQDHTAADIITELSQAIQQINYVNKPLIIGGDFNARIDILDKKAEDLIDFLQSEDLWLQNDPATPTYLCHNGQSTIDLMFSSLPSTHCVTCKVATYSSTPLRKHRPVITTWRLDKVLQKEEKIIKRKRLVDINQLASDPACKEAAHLIERGYLDQAYTLMSDAVLNAAPQTTAKKRSTTKKVGSTGSAILPARLC